jgi:cytochrome d ubiquinol oxidase subunit I
VWQVLRTEDAASTSTGLWVGFIGVLLVYLGMTVGAVVVLRSMARRWRAGSETIVAPYGPGASAVDQAQRARGTGGR